LTRVLVLFIWPCKVEDDSVITLLRLTTPLATVAIIVASLFLTPGCGKQPSTVDPEPFKRAVAEYLERNNMAMALKEIKEGPTIQDKTATMTASLTHAALGGPAVTWQIRFEKNADGSWKAVSHK
jgi:hypothetical protein